MRNWLIKLLGGYTEQTKPLIDESIAEYSRGFREGHLKGYESGRLAGPLTWTVQRPQGANPLFTGTAKPISKPKRKKKRTNKKKKK